MDVQEIRDICIKLPGVTEDIKWGNDLCFLILKKMFCVVVLIPPQRVSLKVLPEEFEELVTSHGIVPAPYVAKHKWILVEDLHRFNKKQWEYYITQSYNLVKAKLPKKKLAGINKQNKK